MVRWLLPLMLASSLAPADQSAPRSAKTVPTAPAPSGCARAPGPVLAEIGRLLKSAGEHASHTRVCTDGDGEQTTVALRSACVVPSREPGRSAGALTVEVRYQVTVRYEVGGECSPYPACAEPPPPSHASGTVTLVFSAAPEGLKVTLPAALPGISLKTPLARKHSTGCNGDRAAFVPRLLVVAP